jgi:formiminotetrahydrofolate cyclodeaminase
MAHIKEPIGIDLIIKPMPLSEEDRQAISAIIAAYKMTGEMPKLVRKAKTTRKTKIAKSQTPYILRKVKNMPASI